jgi:hypothetical protein
VFLFAILMAACGQEPQPPAQKRAEGPDIVPAFPQTAQAERVGRGAPDALPSIEEMHVFRAGSYPELPSYVPIYPGATVKRGFTRSGRIRAGNLILETAAPVADVITFYQKAITGAGFAQTMNTESGGTMIFAAGRRTVQVTAEPIATGSRVRIFWTGIE